MNQNYECLNFENDDIFNRKEIADKLTAIAKESEMPLSIAVDSYWGSGKSTFLKMWQAELEKVGHNTIFLDAWETDYYSDPIIPLVGSLEKMLELNEATNEDIKNALKVIVYELVKLTTSVIDLEKIESSFKSTTRDNLFKYNSLEYEKTLIRNKLSKFSGAEKTFFFVDELDRCKPSYSIALLERIKHFLPINNFIFIFAVDLSQLGESIKAVYGNINIESYFRKFFDLTLHLPTPKTNNYFKYLFDSNDYGNVYHDSHIQMLSEIVAKDKKIGLRECEKLFNVVRICNSELRKISGCEYMIPQLIILKVVYPEIYKKFLAREINLTNDLFNDWGLESIYHDYDHVKNIIDIYGLLDKRERVNKRRELWNESYIRDDMRGLIDYAEQILEFATLF